MQQDQKLPFSHQRMEPRTLIVRARNEFTRRGALVVHSCPALGGPCRRRFFVLVPEEECRSKGTSGKLEKSVWVFFLCFFCFRVCVCVCFFSYCVCVLLFYVIFNVYHVSSCSGSSLGDHFALLNRCRMSFRSER